MITLGSIKTHIVNYFVNGSKRSSKHYISKLKKMGVQIGTGTVFYDPPSNVIDIQNPYLLQIGNNVRITHGVIILTHDYSWSVVAGRYGECIGNVAPVTIGDNVFIGMNAIVLNGVKIGNNVIIGAGSIVTKDCEDDSVYAGSPARKIMSLYDYYNCRKSKCVEESKHIFSIVKAKDAQLVRNSLREYSFLFEEYTSPTNQRLMKDTGYYDKCVEFYRNSSNIINDEIKGLVNDVTG